MSAPARFRSDDGDAERALMTPEGVMLRLQLATVGQRLGAFLLDLAMMAAVLVVLTLVVILAATGLLLGGGKSPPAAALELVGVIWLLGFFALRNLWFIGFECGRRTATPGKRAFGIRVIARDGGRLSADAVVARNMLRELEFFLPLSFVSYEAGTGAFSAWTALAGLGWSLTFAVFPLFNRDRLRIGDLVAGTWVLRTPRRRLGSDVAAVSAAREFVFTEAQLGLYGVFELQKLEDVLRGSQPDPMRRDPQDPIIAVAASVRRKIGPAGGDHAGGGHAGGDDHAFLSAYYRALRARLERQLLLSRARADKNDG